MEHTPCRFRDDQSGEDMLRLFLRLLPTINARQLAWFRADLQGGMLRISPPGRELRQSALRSQTDCTHFPRNLAIGAAIQPKEIGQPPTFTCTMSASPMARHSLRVAVGIEIRAEIVVLQGGRSR
jgi:hypothetical protein